MAKNQQTIIIISDDELDEVPPTPVQLTTKAPVQKNGYSKTNPINLDTDDSDRTQTTPVSTATLEQHNQFSTKYELSELSTSKTSDMDSDSNDQPTRMETDPSSPLQSNSTTSSMVLSLDSNTLHKSAASVFGLSVDVFDFITNQQIIDPDISMETEPDWSYISRLGIIDEDTKDWEPPKREPPLPVTTKVPEGMCLNEFFTRLDYYQYSMNLHVQGVQPKVPKGNRSNNNSPSPTFSSTGIVLPSPSTSGRTSLKRNKAHSHSHKINTTDNNKVDHEMILARLLESKNQPILQRPYVPVAVWQGSNWEDWAQFSVGDLIHVPFSKAEDEVVKKMGQRVKDRKRKASPVPLGDDGIWSDAPALLPGRVPDDCMFRYQDIQLEKSHLFTKPQVVTIAKAPSKNRQSYYNLISSQQLSGKVSMNIFHSAVWKNLGTELTIGGGSGDASCLLLEGDIKYTDSLQVIAGSLCDDNQSYNMEGNLREWQYSTRKITQMKSHFDETPTSDGGTQVSWRTVHDIKTSNDKTLVFSASRDGKAKIWNRQSNKLVSTLVCHSGPVHQISVKSGTGNIIATGSFDGSGVIWNVIDGGKMGEGVVCSTQMVDDLDICSVECLEFGHDASVDKLFMGYRTEVVEKLGWITAFDACTAQSLYDVQDMRGSVGCMAIAQSGKYILSGNDSSEGGDQLLHVNDAMTGKSVLKARTGHLDVNCVAFSRCDNYIASGSVNNQISIFDMRKPDRPVYSFLHDGNARQDNERYIAPDAGIGISGMYWMKGNNILITAGGDCAVNLWDVSGGDGLLKSYKAADPVSCLAVNEDLHTIAAGASGSQGLVHVWRP